MRDGFYIGTFHNDNGVYIDSVRVIDKPEVFEMIKNCAYRINDMFVYQHTDFLNPILLDEAPDIQPLVEDKLIEGYYWAIHFYSIKWEVIQIIKTVRNQFRYEALRTTGTFEFTCIKHLGPLIDLKIYHTALEADKT